MELKGIIDEDFVNYKKPSMFLATCYCDWKCLAEKNLDTSICQNSELANQENIEISVDKIIERYLNNPITQAIVIGGLEPIKQFDELLDFIFQLRIKHKCNDDVVIYTGYYPIEIVYQAVLLSKYKNIIVKFGRFETNSDKRFDEILGVWLSSSNQRAEKIS